MAKVGGPSAEDRAYHARRGRQSLTRTARRRARCFGVGFGVVSLLDVLDRDGWFCQICRGPIDPAGRWVQVRRGQAQPKSNLAMPSFDHLVPLCRGGGHCVGNVRAAHLNCNVWRLEFPPGAGGPPWAPGPQRSDWTWVALVCGQVGHVASAWCLCAWCLRYPLLPASREALYKAGGRQP